MMRQAPEDRITPDTPPEISAQNLVVQKPEDFRGYLQVERDAESVSRLGALTRADGVAMHLRQRVLPAREAALRLVRLDLGLIAFHDFDPQTMASYNRLAISLISGSATQNLQRLLITSAQFGEGRTCVTLNLAAALARARQRVLVVDTDFARPSALRLLGVDVDFGLAEAITNGFPIEQAMIRVKPVGFNLLPTRAQVENSAELLAAPGFEAMIQMLKPDYDFMLFDSAPLLAAADASLLELHTDATLMVIRPGYTSTQKMAKAISLLNERRLFGAVLNRVVT